MIRRLLSPIVTVLLFAPMALAQIPLGGPGPSSPGVNRGTFDVDYSLSGRVTDFQGHPLTEAHIILTELQSGRVVGSSLSHADGSFQIENLSPGQYVLTANKGIYQVQQQVALTGPFAEVTLQLPVRRDNGGVQGGDTVSVRQFQVPKKARKLLDEAQKAYQDNNRDKAIRRTDEALQQFPDFGEALTLRAVLYLQENQGDKARKLSEKAIQDDPTYGLGYIVLGSAYNMLGRFDDALRALARAVSFTPNSWQGYYESARAHLGKKEFRQALEDVNKAANSAPKNFTAIHLVRAQAYLGLNSYPDAMTSLKEYLKLDPKGDEAPAAQQMLNRLQSSSPTTEASN
jgi:Tfp pilus assembly protein PilF